MVNWITVTVAAVVAMGGWMASRVVGLGQRTSVLEQRTDDQETILKGMSLKLDQVADDTAAIRVSLGEPPHV